MAYLLSDWCAYTLLESEELQFDGRISPSPSEASQATSQRPHLPTFDKQVTWVADGNTVQYLVPSHHLMI
jgi:hypothetical protein